MRQLRDGLFYHAPLVTPEDMTALVQYLETERGYEPGSMILVNFQRLEDSRPVGQG